MQLESQSYCSKKKPHHLKHISCDLLDFLLKTRIQWPFGSNSREVRSSGQGRSTGESLWQLNRAQTGAWVVMWCGLVGKQGRAGLSLLEMAACFMSLCVSYTLSGACWFYIHKWLVCFGSLGWGGMQTLPRGLSSQGRTFWLLPLTTPCWSLKIKQQICPIAFPQPVFSNWSSVNGRSQCSLALLPFLASPAHILPFSQVLTTWDVCYHLA